MFPKADLCRSPDSQLAQARAHKDQKQIVKDLRPIYRAATDVESLDPLAAFEQRRPNHPMITEMWRRNWERFTPFFALPEDIR
jgi:putative transposase